MNSESTLSSVGIIGDSPAIQLLARQIGLFQAAQNGTIFFDEIAEMSTASQVKLLRVLQEGAVRSLGTHAEIQIDVRVIAATNRNLPREVSAGRFREDLFYRIAVLAINTPPLRDRKSDIPLLMQYFHDEAEQKIKSAMPRKLKMAPLMLSLITPSPAMFVNSAMW